MAHTGVRGTLITIQFALIGYVLFLAFYRLFLSPLSKVPGPKLAALTFWYERYFDVFKRGRYVFKIKELHDQYGPIIRVTPVEVHIKDVGFLENIYPASNLRKREKYWRQLRGLDVGASTASTIPHELHRRRREALNPFFSQRNVITLEPMLRSKVLQLCEYFEEALDHANGEVLNLYDLYYAFARDIVFQYSFGKDSNVLGNAGDAAVLRENLSNLLLGVQVAKHFQVLFKVIKMLPLSIAKHFIPPGVKHMGALVMRIRGEINQVLVDTKNEQKIHKRSIFYELRDNAKLPSPEKDSARLEKEGVMLVMAATESTAKSLGIAHFHLLSNPTIMSKLRSELQSLPHDASLTALLQLPYLAAICHEANRLSFGLTGRNARIAPDETLQYGPYILPPGTPMSMTTLCIHTDESIFPDPWTFNPDRWLGPAGKERQKYQYGFGGGSRKCLGIGLAGAELTLVIATVARYELQLFDTDVSDVTFKHDYQVAHPKLDSKGIRATVVGKAW